jgi:hypothetical protein
MPAKPNGPSWAWLLAIVIIAFFLALLIAHRLVSPFFHHR